MRIKYPEKVKTAAEKTAFLYRLQEALRENHNSDAKLADWEVRSEIMIKELLLQRTILKNDKTQNASVIGSFE